ncbi:ethanolamine ammonia-lyase subunit EutC [Neiella marina]|uniref:Ethanolamine ammonia-lyase small subunit n=1 Tax=Neiella holothuriorum TaxID=2870530 RepID=A0ABS7EBX5_9GAMM|nr:ethanolamine ammonia-lyase subunit EutC [Neiella holothuriorum]MBW8189719.1 ethanolamine ammonia-lyase subunit EutC [Neiella holothuriorum]
MSDKPAIVQHNPWQKLRRYTDARIALGRVGDSLPTQAHLEFQLAHAKARDAVHLPLDYELLQQQLSVFRLPILTLESQASDRACYLQRPDLGRLLSEQSLKAVADFSEGSKQGYDIAIVITEGLSSLAIDKNASPLLAQLLPALAARQLSIAPLCMVKQGRVAVADAIGESLQAKLVLILVGERPGLSSPDSMGVYLTYQPQVGTADSKRNCLSNIREGGLSSEDATTRLLYLIDQALSRAYTGVDLKDETEVEQHRLGQNFLLPSSN